MKDRVRVVDHDPVVRSFGEIAFLCAPFAVVEEDPPMRAHFADTVDIRHLYIERKGNEVVIPLVYAQVLIVQRSAVEAHGAICLHSSSVTDVNACTALLRIASEDDIRIRRIDGEGANDVAVHRPTAETTGLHERLEIIRPGSRWRRKTNGIDACLCIRLETDILYCVFCFGVVVRTPTDGYHPVR